MCFNPRTHEGCDLSHRHMFTAQVGFQSTHPRGVRLELNLNSTIYIEVSIHAPTRGATVPSSYVHRSSWCFNPRTHEGCDCAFKANVYIFRCFNPRTHEGCDLFRSQSKYYDWKFQSTHPRGVRLPCVHCVQCLQKFQSTHPRGVRRCYGC